MKAAPVDGTTRRPGTAKRRGPGWVPNQHGAWAMLATPLLVGVLASEPRWVHLALAAFWVVGYFAFFATGLWLKSHRKARYLPPVRTYGLAALVLGAVVLVIDPALVVWAPLFVPPLAVGLVGQQVFAGEATRLAYMTDEAAEGRDAFLEKRDPDWSSFPWHY